MARTLAAVVVLALAAGSPAVPATGAGTDPWEVLAEYRRSLAEAGPQRWSFEQTYLPAGFEEGERETGTVRVDLPRCVRWDYHDPFPKSFLLCDALLYSWTPGDPLGHVWIVDEEAQAGLDLLRIEVSRLRSRYEAEIAAGEGTGEGEAEGRAVTLRLVPRPDVSGTLRDVELEVAPEQGRILSLGYSDTEGNRTTFEFSDPAPAEGRLPFIPPADVQWEREGPVSGPDAG